MVGKGTRPQHALTSSATEPNAARAPGKRTLAEGAAMAEGARSTHATPPQRVANVTRSEPNAVIKVIAYSRGQLLGKPWGAKGRWEGPLPQKYTGTRGATGWTWDHPDARSVRIGSDLKGRGGRTVEAWAGADADKIVIHASALDAVTNDEGAEQDAHAPGHATDRTAAADGSTPSVKPADKSPGTGKQEPSPHDDGSHDGDLGPSDVDEKIADDFEHELGLDSSGEDGEDDEASGTVGGKDNPAKGRTGPDTRIGGTGPGGERARPDGDGKGAEDGGRGGLLAVRPDAAQRAEVRPDHLYGDPQR